MKHSRYILLLPLLLLLLTQCRKDEKFTDDPNATLEFSMDTVLFDTVFTTIGTVTKRFVVRNLNNEAVRIARIELEGGQASPYRINVDGVPGLAFTDTEILGKDSLYIFVEATLGPGSVNDPFIIEDHIHFITNGNSQEVLLLAWGQDANFFMPDQAIQGLPPFSIIAGIDGNGMCEQVIWTNDKPYVIYGYAVVDSCASLTIEPGVRVYFHGGGGLWVYKHGQIIAQGTVDDRITFQGDRLEPFYDNIPGQWDRIWINEGTSGNDNTFEHVEVKNSLIGIQCESLFTGGQPLSTNKLVLKNVSITNSSAAGILSRNYRITAENLLVANAGQYCVVLTGGGEYNFNHFTIANYWAFDIRNTPAFLLTNRFVDNAGAVQARDIQASLFRNGIIYGSNTEEFELDIDPAAMVAYNFEHTLFRSTLSLLSPEFTNVYKNSDPGFMSSSNGDLHIGQNSYAANDRGTSAGSVFDDLDEIPYSTYNLNGYEIGCYAVAP